MSQIYKGALLNYVHIILTFIIGIIYTPILISNLGQNDYGIYAMVIALVAYLSLMDMGLGNSIVRYLSQNIENGSKKYEAKLIGLFLKLYLFIAIVTLIIGIYISLHVDLIFTNSLNENETNTVSTMILILTINYAISFILNVYSASIYAYENFVFIKVMNLIKLILTPLITTVFLLSGGGLITVTLIFAITNIIFLLINTVYAIKKLEIKFSIEKINRKYTKEIFIYSIFIFISAIADKLYWQTDQLLLGIMDSPKTVAIYAISIQLVMIFASLSTAISNLFLPKLSKMMSGNYNEFEISNLFNKVSKYQFIIVFLFFSGFYLFGERFITLWVGEEFKDAYWIILVIMIPFFIELIQNLGFTIMQAKGVYYFRAIVLVITAILNVIISVPIIENYGYYGTAIVTSIFIGVSNVLIMNVYYQKKLNIDMYKNWKNTFVLFIKIMPLIIVSIFVKNQYSQGFSIFDYLVNIIMYTVLYIILVYILILDKSEKRLIMSKLKRR